jgi:predicted nucleic acid binding AN1-type Zn finger protein
MDLEHTNLGKHCDVADCHQRDFLPFTCDYCSKSLCTNHRTYAAHNCEGNKMKDMTSIDCPLCGKSVKFAKADDVDALWNQHYKLNCNQSFPVKNKQSCYEASCQRQLGPSNSFTCTKCKQQVCLSHRSPEDHHCLGVRGAILSKLPQHLTQSRSKASDYVNGKASKLAATVPESTAKLNRVMNPTSSTAPAQRVVSMKSTAVAPRTTVAPVVVHSCPFCSEVLLDSSSLQIHVDTYHSDNSSPPPITTQPAVDRTSASYVGRAREVCPLCSSRFVEATELVAHFESAHSNTSRTNREERASTATECVMG